MEAGFAVWSEAVSVVFPAAASAAPANMTAVLNAVLANGIAVLDARTLAPHTAVKVSCLSAITAIMRRVAASTPAGASAGAGAGGSVEWSKSTIESLCRSVLEHCKSESSAVGVQSFAAAEQLIAALETPGATAGQCVASGSQLPPSLISALELTCGVEVQPNRRRTSPASLTALSAPFAKSLYAQCVITLASTAIDASVKTRALSCVGLLSDRMQYSSDSADQKSDQKESSPGASTTTALIARFLDNPLTRAAAVQALCRVCRSLPLAPMSVYVTTLLPPIVNTVARFCLQTDPRLQHFAVATLTTLTARAMTCNRSSLSSHSRALNAPPPYSALATSLQTSVFSKIGTFLRADNQWWSQLEAVLDLVAAVIEFCIGVDTTATTAQCGTDDVWNRLCSLAIHSAHPPQSLLARIARIARTVASHTSQAGTPTANPLQSTIDKTLASAGLSLVQRRNLIQLSVASHAGVWSAPFETVRDTIKLSGSDAAASTLSALWVSEIGRCIDLAGVKFLDLKLADTLLPDSAPATAAVDSKQSDAALAVSERAMACAIAFGSCAAASQSVSTSSGTPKPARSMINHILLRLSSSGASTQVLALYALRETLTQTQSPPTATAAVERVRTASEAIFKALSGDSITAAAGTTARSLLGECMGRLSLIQPSTFHQIAALATSANASPPVRRVLIAGAQFFVSNYYTVASIATSATAAPARVPSVLLRAQSAFSPVLGATTTAGADAETDYFDLEANTAATATAAPMLIDEKHTAATAAVATTATTTNPFAESVCYIINSGLAHADLSIVADTIRLVELCATHCSPLLRPLLLTSVSRNGPASTTTAASNGATPLTPLVVSLSSLTGGVIRPGCIARVQLGPITKLVDSAATVRIAALNALTLLVGLVRSEFLTTILSCPAIVTSGTGAAARDDKQNSGDSAGLPPTYEVRLLAHTLITKIVGTGLIDVSALNGVFTVLDQTIRSSLPESSVKEEIEKHAEVVRSAVRVVTTVFTPELVDGLPSADATGSDAGASSGDGSSTAIAAYHRLVSGIGALPAALSSPLVLARQWSTDPLPTLPVDSKSA